MKSVLITGAAGNIGRDMGRGLRDDYLLRLTDCIQIVDPEVTDVQVADVRSVEEMEEVCKE